MTPFAFALTVLPKILGNRFLIANANDSEGSFLSVIDQCLPMNMPGNWLKVQWLFSHWKSTTK